MSIYQQLGTELSRLYQALAGPDAVWIYPDLTTGSQAALLESIQRVAATNAAPPSSLMGSCRNYSPGSGGVVAVVDWQTWCGDWYDRLTRETAALAGAVASVAPAQSEVLASIVDGLRGQADEADRITDVTIPRPVVGIGVGAAMMLALMLLMYLRGR